MPVDCDYNIGREKVTFHAALNGLCKEQKSQQADHRIGVDFKTYLNEENLYFNLQDY